MNSTHADHREPLAVERGQTIFKGPDVNQPVSFHWRDELVRRRTTIAESRWLIVNAKDGIADSTMRIEAPMVESDYFTTRAILTGGRRGAFVVTNSIVTTAGARIDRACIVIVP